MTRYCLTGPGFVSFSHYLLATPFASAARSGRSPPRGAPVRAGTLPGRRRL
jgi:hypothetical protein